MRCSRILLQSVPRHINIVKLENEIRNLPGVIDLHELHVWRLVNTTIIASMHVTCLKGEDFMVLNPKIQEICHKYGIHSTTVQPEFVDYLPPLSDKNICNLPCAEECAEDVCCPRPTKAKNRKKKNDQPSDRV